MQKTDPDPETLDLKTLKMVRTAQKGELTEHLIYGRLARAVKDPHNQEVLQRIGQDELQHAQFWQKYTHADLKPSRLKVAFYVFVARLFGLTFGIKLMEGGEKQAQQLYRQIAVSVPEAMDFVEQEDAHEKELIDLIDEERLRYVGSMVLGLNDALVELTGALAGLTLALQNTRLIGAVGLITGFAASLSMAASEYLSIKSEGGTKSPLKAAAYTGSAYVFTVLFLIYPFLILDDHYLSLGLTIANAILVIFVFTFYISVAQSISFKRRFAEMAAISLSIAAISFAIGYLVRIYMGVEL